jgi:hypothetical protein
MSSSVLSDIVGWLILQDYAEGEMAQRSMGKYTFLIEAVMEMYVDSILQARDYLFL